MEFKLLKNLYSFAKQLKRISMKKQILAMLAISSACILGACSDDPEPTLSEKCGKGLSKGCLVGTWNLSSISNINDGTVIMPYSSGTLKIDGNGEFTFTTPTDAGSALAQNGCGGIENYGKWTIDDAAKTVTFKVTVGDCLYGSATLTPEINATELNLKGAFFLRSDLTDATTSAISTEVYTR